jgi:hypothetical protein
MERYDELKIANLNIDYLKRRVDELERLLLHADTERSRWMKKYQKVRFAVEDHRSLVLNNNTDLPRGVVNANSGLWETVNDQDR